VTKRKGVKLVEVDKLHQVISDLEDVRIELENLKRDTDDTRRVTSEILKAFADFHAKHLNDLIDAINKAEENIARFIDENE